MFIGGEVLKDRLDLANWMISEGVHIDSLRYPQMVRDLDTDVDSDSTEDDTELSRIERLLAKQNKILLQQNAFLFELLARLEAIDRKLQK